MSSFSKNFKRGLIAFVLLSSIQLSKSKIGQNLPRCKYDDDIVKTDKLIPYLMRADFIFTGKVASSVHNLDDRIVFDVAVQKCFKNSGNFGNATVVKVVKLLKEEEGLTCRQVVRKKLAAIFVGIVDMSFVGDVRLSISPVPITLANLDRVSSVTKGFKCHHNETKRAVYENPSDNKNNTISRRPELDSVNNNSGGSK